MSARSEWDARYNRSAKGQARYHRYRDTAKGQRNDRVQHLLKDTRDREARLTTIKETLDSQSH